ncbi:Fur family transcriptional regulator [Streptomyces sp. NPDC052023]|uniref:Fur family transcriptional regulator n=1 Tax=Streptomyces sp. NPDC052023 TaxID=3365681 RepID=UPI0037D07FDF
MSGRPDAERPASAATGDGAETNARSGVALTARRALVLAELRRLGGFASVQQLHAALQARGVTVGLSTVYRTLAAAEAEDLVEAVRGTARLYRYQPPHHVHHLRCTVCGDSVPFVSPVLEEWIESLGPRYGFVHVRHGVRATGVCPDCVGDG